MQHVVFQVGQDQIIFELNKSLTSEDFIRLLPLELNLRDFARAEKISDLPRGLEESEPLSTEPPQVGDLMYYAPWERDCYFL